MVGLLDIAPSTRKVTVGGAQVDVFGVSSHGIAYLITRFPQLSDLIGKSDLENIQIDAGTILKIVPDAIAAIIACGCGFPNDPVQEEAAARISADSQLDLLAAIIDLTMPAGAGPFLEKFNAALRVLDVRKEAPDTTPSPLPSSS